MKVILNCVNGLITVYDKFVDGVKFSNFVESTHEEVSNNPFIVISTIIGNNIVTDIKTAKEFSHAKRRADRDSKLAPLDAEISKQIPGTFESLESQRQSIRDSNADIQVRIDEAKTIDELKDILTEL